MYLFLILCFLFRQPIYLLFGTLSLNLLGSSHHPQTQDTDDACLIYAYPMYFTFYIILIVIIPAELFIEIFIRRMNLFGIADKMLSHIIIRVYFI